jgi:hypothetical protein
MTLPQRAAALAAQLAASRVITPTLTDDAATLTVTLDEAAILAALEDTRREALEEAASIVDQCNLEGPYQAIGAASRIRYLAEPIVSAWPVGCHDPESCGERHRSCMYLGCRHEGRDITSEIDAAVALIDEPNSEKPASLSD